MQQEVTFSDRDARMQQSSCQLEQTPSIICVQFIQRWFGCKPRHEPTACRMTERHRQATGQTRTLLFRNEQVRGFGEAEAGAEQTGKEWNLNGDRKGAEKGWKRL